MNYSWHLTVTRCKKCKKQEVWSNGNGGFYCKSCGWHKGFDTARANISSIGGEYNVEPFHEPGWHA